MPESLELKEIFIYFVINKKSKKIIYTHYKNKQLKKGKQNDYKQLRYSNKVS